jgi:hypothetical protein
MVQLGFWVGGPPGYGYRRLMVSADGKPKETMKHGEHKSLTTDRVILIPEYVSVLKKVLPEILK